MFSWLPPAPLLATPTTSGPAAGVAVPGVPTYPKPRNLQYIFCGFPIFQSCGSSQHRPKDGPNLVQEGANIARRWAKIAPKMASWSKRGQHSRKLVQRRPKMRLLQTLRMGHSHNNNNKNNNKNKNKQTTNNNRRPYKHPAIYGAFFKCFLAFPCAPLLFITFCRASRASDVIRVMHSSVSVGVVQCDVLVIPQLVAILPHIVLSHFCAC